jgi:Tol biopolymer transport system component
MRKSIAKVLIFLPLLLILQDCSDFIIDPPLPEYKSIDESPAWSPDGKWIVYHHTNYNPEDTAHPTGLYIIDTIGNNHRLVIAGPAYNPDWSPDGSKIAFNDGDIFTIAPNGDSLRRVTDLGSTFFPTWSPDGKKIAFDTPYQDPKGANAIWILDLENMTIKDISIHSTGEWRDPRWSPNGGKLVHYRYIGIGTSEIFVMDTSGNNGVRLTYNDNEDRDAIYSPDGLTIAWTGNHGIWLMNSDGSNQRIFLGDNASSPSWSPDSKKITFQKQNTEKNKLVIWTINIDGSGLKQITK